MRLFKSVLAILCLLTSCAKGSSFTGTCPPEREQYFSHPTDCSMYILCVDGNPIELPCPLDWIFDSVELRCLPFGGKCSVDSTTDSPINSTTTRPINSTTLAPTPTTLFPNSTFPSTLPPNTTLTTTLSPNTTLAPNTTTTESPAPFICPPSREETLPHPTDCSRYFLCVDGQPYELPCPSGWLFDSIQLRCLPSGAQCFNGNISTTTLAPNATTTLSPNSTTTLSPNSTTTLSPNSTTTLSPNSTTTLSPNSTTTLSPNSTTTLSPNSTTTLSPNSTTPTTPSPLTTTQSSVSCPEKGEALIPHPDDCSKYFLCVDGSPREMTCPNAWIFDYIQLRCVPIDGRCVNESDF